MQNDLVSHEQVHITNNHISHIICVLSFVQLHKKTSYL